jgi:hypothetical protein
MSRSISENAKLASLVQSSNLREILSVDWTKVNLDFHMRNFGYFGQKVVVDELIVIGMGLLAFGDESILSLLSGLAETQYLEGSGWKAEEVEKIARLLADPRGFSPEFKSVSSKAAQILVKYGTQSQVTIAIAFRPPLPTQLAVGSPDILVLLRSSGYATLPVIVDSRSLMVYKGSTIDPDLLLDLISQVFGLVQRGRYVTLLLLNNSRDQKATVLHICRELGINPKDVPINMYYELYMRLVRHSAAGGQTANITSLTPMFDVLISVGFPIDKPTRFGTDIATEPEFTSFLIRNGYDVCKRIGSDRVGVLFVKHYATIVLHDYSVTDADINKTFGVMCDGKPEAEEILAYIDMLKRSNAPMPTAGRNVITSIDTSLRSLLARGMAAPRAPTGAQPPPRTQAAPLPAIPATQPAARIPATQAAPTTTAVPPPRASGAPFLAPRITLRGGPTVL